MGKQRQGNRGSTQHGDIDSIARQSSAVGSSGTQDGSISDNGAAPSGPLRWARERVRQGGALDRGMATAEYAIATVAAVGFAGLLVVILRSDEVRGLLMGIIRSALHS